MKPFHIVLLYVVVGFTSFYFMDFPSIFGSISLVVCLVLATATTIHSMIYRAKNITKSEENTNNLIYKSNKWHLFTALIFFVSMWGLAISTDRMPVGNYLNWSRSALVFSLLPVAWGVILLAKSPQGLSKTFPFATILLGILVVFIARDYGHEAFMDLMDHVMMRR